ncbi:hAT family C-terminal dimerization region [Popillia japonica]|uniref:HAT family C-terminal dimerization region n=1 Tax=Popillia japonica TaxID=7064 RepID=A0AAW1JZW6_POPJA
MHGFPKNSHLYSLWLQQVRNKKLILEDNEHNEISDSELLKQCSDLQISMRAGESCDIDGHELYEELNMFIRVYEGNDIISVLKYIIEKELTEVYPTIEIVLRIIATTPVTVASAERSFSRLIIRRKIIKTYLRNSMTQDRLSALAIPSIENDVAHSIDYCSMTQDRLSALAIPSIENDVAHSIDYCALIKDFSLDFS